MKSNKSLNILVLFKNSVSAYHLQVGFDFPETFIKEFETVENLVNTIDDSTGAIVIDKDALDTNGVANLGRALSQQPKWSFLPVIMILSPGDLRDPRILEIIKPLANLTILEQPVPSEVLRSVIRSALAERHRQYELRDSLNEAIEANRAKSEFLANMSHEIRTPLGVILGFSDLMATPDLNAKERELYLEIVQRNGQLLSALINDVLDLAKVEAGKLKIERIEISLSELLSDVVSSLKIRVKNSDLKILIEKNIDVPDLVKTDPIRLKQILTNIIGNAIKFTEKGHVKIIVSTDIADQLIQFRVVDTGIGLKPEQISHLFEAFSQADGSITRKFGGTGLGLVLAQKLARALGGDVKLVESTFGKGTTFEISVALERSPQKKLDSNQQHESNTNFDLKGLVVLIVDDSRDNQFLIETYLSRANAKIFLADNGEDGIRMARKVVPDIILMDVQMPGVSGLDAARQLRSEGYKKPIVALTAHALKGDRELCLSAGFTEYLTKPVNRRELLNCLQSLNKNTPVVTTNPTEMECDLHP